MAKAVRQVGVSEDEQPHLLSLPCIPQTTWGCGALHPPDHVGLRSPAPPRPCGAMSVLDTHILLFPPSQKQGLSVAQRKEMLG